jgi:hypothetical protein
LANPTTNYGFVLPTSSDLVTDLPADFDVALQGVDTRLKALQPGTTLGDLAYSSATANTNTRLGVGSTGQVLTVAGGVPSWSTPAAGALTLIVSDTFSAVTSKSFNNCFSATYANYLITINITSATSSNNSTWKLRASGTDSSTNYNFNQIIAYSSTISNSTQQNSSGVDCNPSSMDTGGFATFQLFNPFAAQKTYFRNEGNRKNTDVEYGLRQGLHTSSTSFDGFTFSTDGSAMAGTIRVYGVQNA